MPCALQVDNDANGSIDFEEFQQMMTAKMGANDTREELNKVIAST